jgi:hypothetical protein
LGFGIWDLGFDTRYTDHMFHLPILRQGAPCKSLDVVTVPHYRTREPFVEIATTAGV